MFVSAAPKMVYFSQLPAVKKDTIFGAAKTKVDPSYFVRALYQFAILDFILGPD